MKRFNLTLVLAVGVAFSVLGAAEKHWGYEDTTETVGPAKWGTLAGDATCATGKQQSPVNLVVSAAKPQDLQSLVFRYKPSSLSLTNNGHTVQAAYDTGSILGREGYKEAWTLSQFHFHAPSEHTENGAAFPMEIHLVHLDAVGKPVAVVGILVQAGKENAALAQAFKSLPAKEGDKIAHAGDTIDASALLPADKTFFKYAGSLTTPPCSEGITWYVMKMPIEMSREQIAAYTRLEHLAHTNRPVQPLGARVVQVDSTPGK